MELLPTGKPMSAERATEIGLVWKLVEPDELQAEAWAWARTLTEAAPLAQRATKGEVARRTADMGWIESVRLRRDHARRRGQCSRTRPKVLGHGARSAQALTGRAAGHACDLAALSAVQHKCELIAGERPPVLEIVEFLWGQQGMLDRHECLIVADRLEGDVDDTPSSGPASSSCST